MRLSFEHTVLAAGLIERQNFADARPQVAGVDAARDFTERGGGDVHEHEQGPDTAAVRPLLVGLRHRRDEHTAGPEDVEGARLDLPADQIYHRIHLPDRPLERRRAEVDHLVSPKLMYVPGVPA